MPVEVSFCTTHTALMVCAVSAARAACKAAISMPCCQSQGSFCTVMPTSRIMPDQLSENTPVSGTSTVSPADSTLTMAASQAAWPEPVYMNMCWVVFMIRRMPSQHSSYSFMNSGAWKSTA